MTNQEAKQIIKLLSYGPTSKEHFSLKMAFGRYAKVLTQLVRSTSNADASATIFSAVVNQAHALGKTGEWVEQELYVEADACTRGRGNRLGLIRQLLTLSDGSDKQLDLYNARLTRFSN